MSVMVASAFPGVSYTLYAFLLTAIASSAAAISTSIAGEGPPALVLSFSATWTSAIAGQPSDLGLRMNISLDEARNLVSVTDRVVTPSAQQQGGGGTTQMIDDFEGNNGTWPFVAHCVARPGNSGHTHNQAQQTKCFVGPTGTNPGGKDPRVYFLAQTFSLYDNLTLYAQSRPAGAGTVRGRRVSWWEGATLLPGGIRQVSRWAVSDDGLCRAVRP